MIACLPARIADLRATRVHRGKHCTLFDRLNFLTCSSIRTYINVRSIEPWKRQVNISNTRELGGFLRQAREDAGLTQADLAEKVGARRQRVLYLERGVGQLQLAFVFAVMQALDVTLSIERAAEGMSARQQGVKAGRKAPPYSIDEIADGGSK
jgi:DNA-binding XRE family transcriptional regulator